MFSKFWSRYVVKPLPRRDVPDPNSVRLETRPNGFRWCGVHPGETYAVYQILVKSDFQKACRGATHEIEVKIKSPSGVRVLYRAQSDFRIPFMDNSEVAKEMGLKLVSLLLETKTPRREPGMYSLLYEGEESLCPWSAAISGHRRNLIAQSLKRNGMTVDQYLEDIELYNSLGKPKDRKAPQSF